jgi:hypothetical protein
MTTPVTVSIDIDAPPHLVYGLVSDLTKMGNWSPEAGEVSWRKGATGATRGATFQGANRNGTRTWKTMGTVVTADADSRFAFKVKAAGLKIAEWRYDIEPTAAGCRVTESWFDERGGLAKAIGKLVTCVDDRTSHNRDTMQATLDKLKQAAEGSVTA